MITEKLNTKELFEAFDEISSQLPKLVEPFTDKEFYAIPFAGSWTAAQVCEHISKSNNEIIVALNATGKITEREPGERVLEVKELFLDFTKKFQSPKSVIPLEARYKKEMFTYDLEKQMDRIRELSKSANLIEAINIPGFGELTKLELLHFIIYHTQRHIHQLQNIWNSLKQSTEA